jgi:hypothetical protein
MKPHLRPVQGRAVGCAPARGSALLLWLGWVSVIASILSTAQLDSMQWHRLLGSHADQVRSAKAVQSAMAHAKADLLCMNCRAGSGTPWSEWSGTSPPDAVDGDPNFVEPLRARWEAAVLATPTMATTCDQGLCALGNPLVREASDWLQAAESPSIWSTGSSAGIALSVSSDSDPMLSEEHTRYWIEPWLGTPSTGGSASVWLYRVTVVSKGQREGSVSAAQAIWTPEPTGTLRMVAWRWLSQ